MSSHKLVYSPLKITRLYYFVGMALGFRFYLKGLFSEMRVLNLVRYLGQFFGDERGNSLNLLNSGIFIGQPITENCYAMSEWEHV